MINHVGNKWTDAIDWLHWCVLVLENMISNLSQCSNSKLTLTFHLLTIRSRIFWQFSKSNQIKSNDSKVQRNLSHKKFVWKQKQIQKHHITISTFYFVTFLVYFLFFFLFHRKSQHCVAYVLWCNQCGQHYHIRSHL